MDVEIIGMGAIFFGGGLACVVIGALIDLMDRHNW